MFTPRTANGLLVVASVVIGVLGYLLWTLQRELGVLRESVVRPSITHESLEKKTTASSARDAAKKSSHPLELVETTPATPPPNVSLAPTSFDKSQARARMLDYQRWTRLSKLSRIVERMKLPPEKQARFKELIIAKDFAETDAREASKKAKLDPEQTNTAVENAIVDIVEKLRALLGDADFETYSNFSGAELFWNHPQSGQLLTGYFLDHGAALNREQEAALAEAAYQAFVTDSAAASPTEAGPLIRMKSAQAAVLKKMAPVLLPAQLELLQTFYQRDNELGAFVQSLGNMTPAPAAKPP